MPAQTDDLMTAEELLSVDIPGKWTELVRGHLVVREPPGIWHGMVSGRLTYLVGDFVYRNNVGVVCGQDTGFKVASAPDTVRAPDFAYLTNEQAAAAVGIRGYAAIIPGLVGEVVSPNDRPGELLSRAGMWLKAGVRLVWVIDPDRRVAQVHRPDGSMTVVDMNGALDGETVLPGFSCALADVLRGTEAPDG